MRSLLFAALTVALMIPFASAAEKTREKRPHQGLAGGSVPLDELGKDIKGDKVSISDYHGKVVIVSFWASWCGPCRKELPVLAGVAKRVGPDQLQIIAINFEDQSKPFKYVVDVLKDFPITILRDADGHAAKMFEVTAIPRMIIIGRDGKVASDHTGYGNRMIPKLVDQLNALLAQTT